MLDLCSKYSKHMPVYVHTQSVCSFIRSEYALTTNPQLSRVYRAVCVTTPACITIVSYRASTVYIWLYTYAHSPCVPLEGASLRTQQAHECHRSRKLCGARRPCV